MQKKMTRINQNSYFRQHSFGGWQLVNGNYKCGTTTY